MSWTLLIQVLTVFANIAIVVTAFILLYQARISFNQWQDASVEAERYKKTMKQAKVHDRITEWIHPEFSARRNKAFRYVRNPKSSPADIIGQWENDEDFRAATNGGLNFLEALAQGIFDKILDEGTAKQFFRSIVCPYYEKHKDLIIHIREDGKDKTIFADFEKLAKNWTS